MMMMAVFRNDRRHQLSQKGHSTPIFCNLRKAGSTGRAENGLKLGNVLIRVGICHVLVP